MHLPFSGRPAGALSTDPPKIAPAEGPLNEPLGYAPRPPLPHRRHFRIWVFVALLVIVGAIAPKWSPPVWRRAELLYWQHRCMTATASDTAIAADSEASGVASSYAGDSAFHRFYALLSPPGDRGTPAVFVHQLQTPDGQPRLVVVQAYTYDFAGNDFGDEPEDTSTTLTLMFQARVFRPGGPGRAPIEVLNRGGGSVVVALARPAKVFAGQCDPTDAGRFTFTGSMHDQPFTVDGWLGADERVRMQLRREPAPTPAPRPGTPRRTVAP